MKENIMLNESAFLQVVQGASLYAPPDMRWSGQGTTKMKR
jgi:hypothetical protein